MKNMIISIVVAAAEDHAIGEGNALLWKLPNDMKFFKNTTWGMPVIMGRKTFESMSSKPLNGRLNIVISRQHQSFNDEEGVLAAKSIEHAIELAKSSDCNEVFVIGGGEIYRQVLQITNKIYLTRVHTNFPNADTFFFPLDTTVFKLIEEIPMEADNKHAFAYTFQIWERA
jgi:dihydrofolate reductase